MEPQRTRIHSQCGPPFQSIGPARLFHLTSGISAADLPFCVLRRFRFVVESWTDDEAGEPQRQSAMQPTAPSKYLMSVQLISYMAKRLPSLACPLLPLAVGNCTDVSHGALNSMKVVTDHFNESQFDTSSAYRVYSRAAWELLRDKAMDAAARDEVHGRQRVVVCFKQSPSKVS